MLRPGALASLFASAVQCLGIPHPLLRRPSLLRRTAHALASRVSRLFASLGSASHALAAVLCCGQATFATAFRCARVSVHPWRRLSSLCFVLLPHQFKGVAAWVALLAVCLLVAGASANVLLHKSLGEEYFAEGVNVTITISVYNLGEQDITDVDVSDRSWPAAHFEVHGDATRAYGRIAAGSNETFTYQVQPSFTGFYVPERAQVTYTVNEDEVTLVRDVGRLGGFPQRLCSAP